MTAFYAKKKNVIAANTLMGKGISDVTTEGPISGEEDADAPKYLVSNKIFCYHP